MRFLSLFSGIEAASVAWHPLGWQCVGVAEIDPFPCAVLKHHYPDVPNLGSVTEITDEQIAALGPIDLVVGGSPCQDLSVAGKRAGLAGERSGLFHEQLRIFHAARHFCGARYLLWENVPGAFSSNRGLDFAVVVGAMAGCNVPVPADGWGTEGVALGEHGLVEWAVLDAQWFGVAQRRRRVFALLDVGDWIGRPPILLEPDSLRGDSAPSREAWEGSAGRAARSVALRGREGGGTAELGDELQNCLRASGGGGDKPHVLIHADPIARCVEFQPSAEIAQRIKVDERGCWVWQNRLTRRGYGQICVSGKFHQAHRYSYAQAKGEIADGLTIDHLCKNRACVNPAHLEAVDFKTNNMRSDSVSAVNSRKTHCNNGHAFDEANTGYRNGTHERYCRACKREEARRRSAKHEVFADDIAKCITAGEAKRQDWETCNFVAHSLRGEGFDASEDGAGRGTPLAPVNVCPTLRAGGNRTGGDRPPGTDVDTADSLIPVAFTCKDYGADAGEIAPTLRSMGHNKSHANAGGQVAIAFNARQDPDHWNDRTGPLDTDGSTQAVSYAIQAGALRTNPASGPDGVGVQADHAYTLEARAEVQAVAFAENSRAEVRLEGGDGSRCGAISTGGGKAGQGVPMIMQGSEPETLYTKGFNDLEEGNASTQETYPGALLRTLRQEAGEEAFAKWGLGILDSLQQEEVLRQALHGISIRPATFSRSWVVCCALGFPVYGSGWLLQSLREAGCERCSSQGWEPSEQLAGELGAYLSELSRPGAQAARLMRDLWFASEGFGLLQQALLAIQEVGRPSSRKGQSVLRGSEGRRAETPEDVSSARMQREAPRERVLHEARAAGEARDYRNGAAEQERSGKGRVGEAPLTVRRLIVEECEFLQGFPRGYSKIPWRNKPASECPDGPRYKALGNSFAVPVVRWIGRAIVRSTGAS